MGDVAGVIRQEAAVWFHGLEADAALYGASRPAVERALHLLTLRRTEAAMAALTALADVARSLCVEVVPELLAARASARAIWERELRR